ncbi:MAG: 6,7-dimethyl-8-ribityllumazine synthase [Longimicrobiales bacterium]|nr:6,7-dimethyl-8-ribityllumazine synthase [Longimicrobiales bacterium]
MEARGLRIAVLVSRFNGDITERLLEGALSCLREHGASDGDVDVYRVPGAWELPQAAARVAALGRHDALVTLGCVIRGETPHFDYVCDQANRGLGEVARSSRSPLVFGVLTTDDRAQALARAGAGTSNKGYEVAIAALQMVALYRSLGDP